MKDTVAAVPANDGWGSSSRGCPTQVPICVFFQLDLLDWPTPDKQMALVPDGGTRAKKRERERSVSVVV